MSTSISSLQSNSFLNERLTQKYIQRYQLLNKQTELNSELKRNRKEVAELNKQIGKLMDALTGITELPLIKLIEEDERKQLEQAEQQTQLPAQAELLLTPANVSNDSIEPYLDEPEIYFFFDELDGNGDTNHEIIRFAKGDEERRVTAVEVVQRLANKTPGNYATMELMFNHANNLLNDLEYHLLEEFYNSLPIWKPEETLQAPDLFKDVSAELVSVKYYDDPIDNTFTISLTRGHITRYCTAKEFLKLADHETGKATPLQLIERCEYLIDSGELNEKWLSVIWDKAEQIEKLSKERKLKTKSTGKRNTKKTEQIDAV